jgi:hypothetical protein
MIMKAVTLVSAINHVTRVMISGSKYFVVRIRISTGDSTGGHQMTTR